MRMDYTLVFLVPGIKNESKGDKLEKVRKG